MIQEIHQQSPRLVDRHPIQLNLEAHQNLIETLQPEDTIGALLVEKIACLAWRQRRAV